MSHQSLLFFRSGKQQKSPSVVLIDFEKPEILEAIPEEPILNLSDLSDLSGLEDNTEFDRESETIQYSVELENTELATENWDWDPITEEQNLEEKPLENLTTGKNTITSTQKILASENQKTFDIEAEGGG